MSADPVIAQKLAIGFAKLGRARYHSHHDLLRLFGRAVRRAGLPVRLTSGFNPRPRLVFPHALGVGIASCCEEVEIELVRWIRPEDAGQALARELEPVVRIQGVRCLPPRRRGRQVSASTYCVQGWQPAEMAQAALEALAGDAPLMLTRQRARQSETVDLRRWLRGAVLAGRNVEITLAHTDRGAGRIDDILQWLVDQSLAGEQRLETTKVRMHWVPDDAKP